MTKETRPIDKEPIIFLVQDEAKSILRAYIDGIAFEPKATAFTSTIAKTFTEEV